MRSDIAYRAIEIIREVADPSRRTKELEEETGIPSMSWKNVWNKKQRPTIAMIEAIARRWPHYAFWLVTGITDEEHGHTAPQGAWTCNQKLAEQAAEDAAKNYFNLKIFHQNLTYGLDGATLDAEEAEIASGKETTSSDKAIDAFFNETKPNSIAPKKLKELDYVIAKISLKNRQNHLKQQFFQNSEIDDEIFKTIEEQLKTKRNSIKQQKKQIRD